MSDFNNTAIPADPTQEDCNPNDFISIVDEDGQEHLFEEIDRVELPCGTFVALLPLGGEEEDADDDELALLRVEEADGETCLSLIEDEEELATVSKIFAERLDITFDEA